MSTTRKASSSLSKKAGRTIACITAAVIILLSASSCKDNNAQTNDDVPESTVIDIGGYSVTKVENIKKSAYDGNEYVSDWLAERDGYKLDRVYVLASEKDVGDTTEYSFLIYKRNTDKALSAALDVTEYASEERSELNVRFTETDDGGDGYSLTYVSIRNPRKTGISIFFGDIRADKMISVTDKDISPIK